MNTECGCAGQFAIDHETLDKLIEPSNLARKWRCGWGFAPWFFRRAPATIVVQRGKQAWFDTRAGVGGSGSTSLVAHVRKISEHEAAWLVLQYFATKRGMNAFRFAHNLSMNG